MASAMYSNAVVVELVATFVELRLVAVQVRPDLNNVTGVAGNVVAKLGTLVATQTFYLFINSISSVGSSVN